MNGTPTPKCAECDGTGRDKEHPGIYRCMACGGMGRPTNPIGTPTPKCGTCGGTGHPLPVVNSATFFEIAREYFSTPENERPPCPDCRGTPTGRTPTTLTQCRCGHSQWEHKKNGMQECTLCLCPSFIDERAPTPGSTTGVDGFTLEARAIEVVGQLESQLASLRTELADWKKSYDMARTDLAAALKREAEARADLASAEVSIANFVEMHGELTRDAREARERAIEECATLVEGEPYGESVHTIAARIRALAPVPTAEAKEPTRG